MTVVAAGELHDPIPAGGGARQAHGGHRRLCTRRDEADHLHRLDGIDDALGQLHLELDGVAVGDPALELGSDRRHHSGRLMAEDVRPVREHEVDEVVAICVDDVRTLAPDDVRRHTRAPRGTRARGC